MDSLSGTITACITPFVDDSIDINGLRENIEYQISGGVDGILVLGTTGETPTLSGNECEDVIRTAVTLSKGKTAVWVGTGTNSTKTTIENTRIAEELGADVALVVTPYYNCPTQEGIYQHILAVHENTNIPMCLYNIPKRTGLTMDTETILRLAKLPRVVAIKDATGNLNQLQEIISASHPEATLSIFSGDDALTVPMMAMGAVGLISVASNLIPETIVSMVKAARDGDFVKARQYHYDILPLMKAFFIEANPIPIKAAMKLWDMPSGRCRLPLTEIEEDNLRILSSILQKYAHVNTSSRRTS